MANKTAYLRMLAYLITIAMHAGNIMVVDWRLKREIPYHTGLATYGKLLPRFFTCWTVFIQMMHAVVGLICDYLILSNSEDKSYKLPKHLKGFKDTLFNGVLWPSTWVVFLVFWPIYNYDRRLLYPDYAEIVISTTSNHIMHTAIIFVVLWEVYFRPMVKPKSHKRNLLHLIFHLLLYLSVLMYTYVEHDFWLYPIVGAVYGTIYFPMLHACIVMIALFSYYMQWHIINYFWSNPGNTKKLDVKC